MKLFLDVLLDTLKDTAKMLPFLFGVYLLIEYLEHKASDRLPEALRKMGPFGPIGGAAIGCLPQCGFSVAAANLYSGRLISLGTLLAVFLATSDEAVPILLSDPSAAKRILPLIGAKLVIAISAGILTDLIIRLIRLKRNTQQEPYRDLCEDCGCEEHGIVRSAAVHTARITLFVFAVSLAMGLAIALLGEDAINGFLLADSPVQPFVTALIGLIPNCAASVVLTNLYAAGSLSFGSVIAGLSTGAGMGLAVLFKTNKGLKENISITALLYLVGALSGLIIELIF